MTKNRSKKKNKSKKKKKRAAFAVPLAPPPMRSRKRARKVTTEFHRLTRLRDELLLVSAGAAEADADAAIAAGGAGAGGGEKRLRRDVRNDEVAEIDRRIERLGGRAEYQRASQVSTSFFSTSRWVLGYLARNGWLYGIQRRCADDGDGDDNDPPEEETDNDGGGNSGSEQKMTTKKKRKRPRRHTRLLEVGAINTELLDAATPAAAPTLDSVSAGTAPTTTTRLQVRAIDLHSMHEGRIEEEDFLQLPVPRRLADRYDVAVCSMVLNCVTLPSQRGDMVARLFHCLRPGGLCFVTVPKSCLTLSPYIDKPRFRKLLEVVGFEVLEEKDSPKVSFFVCRRQVPTSCGGDGDSDVDEETLKQWAVVVKIREGRKYRNEFSISLTKESLAGSNLIFSD